MDLGVPVTCFATSTNCCSSVSFSVVTVDNVGGLVCIVVAAAEMEPGTLLLLLLHLRVAMLRWNSKYSFKVKQFGSSFVLLVVAGSSRCCIT